MKVIVILLLIIVLLITAWFFWENIKLNKLVDKQQEELDISANFIKKLNKKIAEVNRSTSSKTKEEKTQALIDTYIKEQKDVLNKNSNEKPKYSEQRKYLPDIIPVKGDYAISQKFSETHSGLDFAAPTGSEVVAVAAGEILSVYYDEVYGNVIMIDHFNEYATLYAHLATTFFEGKSKVNKGETIALVGNTGNSSAPHLHFEIMLDGENVDPENYVDIKK